MSDDPIDGELLVAMRCDSQELRDAVRLLRDGILAKNGRGRIAWAGKVRKFLADNPWLEKGNQVGSKLEEGHVEKSEVGRLNMSDEKEREIFENWAAESYGGDISRFLKRCAPPHEDEYQAADLEQAWKSWEFRAALEPIPEVKLK